MKSEPVDIANLKEFIDVEVFTKEINEEIDLNEAMRTQTARCAYYSRMRAQAKKQKGYIDNLVRAQEAKYKAEWRKALMDEAVKIASKENTKPERITNDMIQAAVFSDPRMIKLMRIQLDAQEIFDVCHVAYDAFKVRQDMLISMGHMARAEMQQEMKMKGQEATSQVKNSAARFEERRARRAAQAE